jgi:hypothetical protein
MRLGRLQSRAGWKENRHAWNRIQAVKPVDVPVDSCREMPGLPSSNLTRYPFIILNETERVFVTIKFTEPYSGSVPFGSRRPEHRLSWLTSLFSSVLPGKYGDSTPIRPCSLPSKSFLVYCPSMTLCVLDIENAEEKSTEVQRYC